MDPLQKQQPLSHCYSLIIAEHHLKECLLLLNAPQRKQYDYAIVCIHQRESTAQTGHADEKIWRTIYCQCLPQSKDIIISSE